MEFVGVRRGKSRGDLAPECEAVHCKHGNVKHFARTQPHRQEPRRGRRNVPSCGGNGIGWIGASRERSVSSCPRQRAHLISPVLGLVLVGEAGAEVSSAQKGATYSKPAVWSLASQYLSRWWWCRWWCRGEVSENELSNRLLANLPPPSSLRHPTVVLMGTHNVSPTAVSAFLGVDVLILGHGD